MDSRFDRHNLISGWDQGVLASATVIIVGVGALGNEVARLLALSGVGNLILCDPDRIERSNLSRCSLFRESDVGRWKVEAAAEALADLAPGISVLARLAPLVHGIGLAELRDSSLVFGCLDSRSARIQLAGRCRLVRARSIDGGTHPWGGEVRLDLDPDGPCFGCSLNAAQRAVVDAPWSCLDIRPTPEVGASAPTSAVIGSLMTLVGTRFLFGLPVPSGTMEFDGTRGTTGIVQQVRDPDCPLHTHLNPPTKLPIGNLDRLGDLRDALAPGHVPLSWVSVQASRECPRCRYQETQWGLPALEPCPNCETTLRPRTTLELDRAPADLPLVSLGIPTREILAVRSPEGIEYIELER